LEADAEGGPRASVPKAASSAGATGAPSPPRRVWVSPWPLAANADGAPRASPSSSIAGAPISRDEASRAKETKRREKYQMGSVERSRRAFWSYPAQIQVHEVLKVGIVSK
jgi:hypothetical protein